MPETKIKWPATLDDLKAAGYRWDLDPRAHCKGCNAPIIWVITPAGKNMPLSMTSNSPGAGFLYQPHFADCPNVAQYRRSK